MNNFCLENTYNNVKAAGLEIIPLVSNLIVSPTLCGTDLNMCDHKMVNVPARLVLISNRSSDTLEENHGNPNILLVLNGFPSACIFKKAILQH